MNKIISLLVVFSAIFFSCIDSNLPKQSAFLRIEFPEPNYLPHKEINLPQKQAAERFRLPSQLLKPFYRKHALWLPAGEFFCATFWMTGYQTKTALAELDAIMDLHPICILSYRRFSSFLGMPIVISQYDFPRSKLDVIITHRWMK